MHYQRGFTIYKQPFDDYFPDGLNVDDVVNHRTVVSYLSETTSRTGNYPYTVFKVEPIYK